MVNIDAAFKNNRLMKALTGMTIEEFNRLLPEFERVWIKQFDRKNRQRAIGGGRKGELKTIKHKLFFILFYLKIYPTFDLAGFIFGGVSKSKPCEWYPFLLKILEEVLKRKCSLPKRRIRSIEEFIQAFPEVKEIFIDGTERRVQRSKNPKKQKNQYSGKKKAHTRKNTIIGNKRKRILVVSPTKNGTLHDKPQLEKEGTLDHIPSRVDIWVDKGYEGIRKLIKNGNNVFMPKKKPKSGELTEEEKEDNKIISSIRMVVEHSIGGLKRFRCLSDIFRNKKGQDDKFITICAGLWNFHLQPV